ncbi:MAG: GNAT family N-acetyltransferase [Treponema sp.]|jgi:ribosomal protein S18 acetylase RimI-like enzyme|nr:GNAT family N-acetyltransferase [Treponema sp.]
MKRASKEKAIGQKDIHSFLEHKNYLNEVLCKNYEVYIAIQNEKVIGIIVFNETEVNQLYIHNDYQGRGIGKILLDIAKNKSTGKLTLFTFEVNHKAQRFYERNGFRIIGRNYKNEENLNDIKYEWIQENKT